MRNRWCTRFAQTGLLALAFIATSNSSVSATQPSVQLGDIKAHLYYEETGRFSPNILKIRDFSLWNTCIGEGSAEEIANDVFVAVELISNGELNVKMPLKIAAKDENGRVVADRIFNDILTSSRGRISKGILLRDVGCGGSVTIDVTFGKQNRRTKLDFFGGE